MASALIAATQKRFRTGTPAAERGQTMAEYAVVLAVLTPLTLAAWTLLGQGIAAQLSKVSAYISF